MSFKLTAKQRDAIEVLSRDAMYTLLYGGSRSTKTFTILRTIVIRALAAAKSRHAVLRFRFNHVKSSVIYDTFPKVMDLCFPGVPYELNKTDWFATLPNGSEIWFGGLDDKERTEKILGNEYASVFLNECSQVSYQSFLVLITRLAQKATYEMGGKEHDLRLKFYCDENPPMRGHWTHRLFIERKDPDTRKPLTKPENYEALRMNPADNAENLPQAYLEALEGLPERQRNRFWLGLFGDDTENALWTVETIEASRVKEAPQMVRVTVAVDPSGADDDPEKNNDAIGIGAAGLGVDGNVYILEDATVKAGPKTWGQVAAGAYERHGAGRIVGETNYGGAMVEFVVKAADPNVNYVAVTASRGKMLRAEPVAALHEQGRIKMVGTFPELEDEMLACTTAGYMGPRSPNRLDWMVFAVLDLFPTLTRPATKPEPLNIPTVVPALRQAHA